MLRADNESFSEEEDEEITSEEIVGMWNEKLIEVLTKLGTTSNRKIEESLRKSDAVREDFKCKMELLQREMDRIKEERKKHKNDLKELRNKFEKAKNDHQFEVTEMRDEHQQQLKEIEDFHEKRYKESLFSFRQLIIF